MSATDEHEIKLEPRYPESRSEDITDAFMRGYVAAVEASMKVLKEREEENDKLREELDAVGVAAYLYGKEQLEAENAKLRELVSDMWRFTGAACKKYPRLFDPSAQGGQMVQLNAIDAFELRMRELGIEVDE